MKERPILFSAPMVRAILSSTKTQTRRVVKSQPIPDSRFAGGWKVVGKGGEESATCSPLVAHHSPYGQPGDRLAVRETFFAWGRWETRYSAKKGRDEWHFVDMTLECGRSYAYDTDEDTPMIVTRRSTVVPLWWRRPAIFMPRAASRITLEITGVRVERLQDISEADCVAEGMRAAIEGGLPKPGFEALWRSINGDTSWEANPWVWAIDFKRLP